ncbi:MAG TPA: hypothetical protein VN970_07380 [Thermoanaerobaculia bacterium]|nr:hypothetical protein [Thermoanaerobaculia bacterium]
MKGRPHHGWPASLVRIAELVGDAAALKLVASFGGTRIYVQKRPAPGSPLAHAIGMEAAKLLAKGVGSGEIVLPTAYALKSKKRAILQASGTNDSVARDTGSTRRYVQIVRNGRGRHDKRQGRLL